MSSNLVRLKDLEARLYPLLPPVFRPILGDLLFAEMLTDLGIYGHDSDDSQNLLDTTFQRIEKAISALEADDTSKTEILKGAQALTEKEREQVLDIIQFLHARSNVGRIVRGAFEYATMRIRQVMGLS